MSNNALVTIRNELLRYSTIRQHPLSSVYSMMLLNGGGYRWNAVGELVTYGEEDEVYKYSEHPLLAAQEKFVHDNIDLLMEDISGIFGGPNILEYLSGTVYHGHSNFETVPANVSNGWNFIVIQVLTDLECFVNPQSQSEFYYKYQFDTATKLLDSFYATDYYKNVVGPNKVRTNEFLKALFRNKKDM